MNEPNSKAYTHTLNQFLTHSHTYTAKGTLRADGRGRVRREGGVSGSGAWVRGLSKKVLVLVLVLCSEARKCQSKELPIAKKGYKSTKKCSGCVVRCAPRLLELGAGAGAGAGTGALLARRSVGCVCVVLGRSIHFCWQESSDFFQPAAAGGRPKTLRTE